MWYRLKVKKKKGLGLDKSPNPNIEQMLAEKHNPQYQSNFDRTDTAPTVYKGNNSAVYNQAYESNSLNPNKGFYQNSV